MYISGLLTNGEFLVTHTNYIPKIIVGRNVGAITVWGILLSQNVSIENKHEFETLQHQVNIVTNRKKSTR